MYGSFLKVKREYKKGLYFYYKVQTLTNIKIEFILMKNFKH